MKTRTIEPLDLGRTPFAVVDLETSGFSPKLHRVLEIAIVRVAQRIDRGAQVQV